MNKLKHLLLSAMALVLPLTFTACSDDDKQNNNSNATDAQVAIRLTDGPADYDAIWLDIREVEVRTNSGNKKYSPVYPGLYNILELSNGIDTLLLSGPMPAATVSQIRLLLGPDSKIVVDGVTHELNTPSAEESGLKLNLNEKLEPGVSYTFWLDFDAAKSIVETGSGKYKLKPVIRAYTALTNGRIAGYVKPAAALTTVYAVHGTDTFSAIPHPVTGYFQISGLPEGTYTVYYDADAPGYADHWIEDVDVDYGTITNLGTYTSVP